MANFRTFKKVFIVSLLALQVSGVFASAKNREKPKEKPKERPAIKKLIYKILDNIEEKKRFMKEPSGTRPKKKRRV